MEEDWDNLLIFDGCRADLFEQVVDLSFFDDYRQVKSLGSATGEWSIRNFSGKEFGDTVYVTGNPNPSKEAGDTFHYMDEVWRHSFDEEQLTVHPEAIIESTKEAIAKYPNKRLILHFMQPHRPFLHTEKVRYSSWQPDVQDGVIQGTTQGDASNEGPDKPWEALERGYVDREEVWEAYAKNLEYVYDEVYDFLPDLPGRSVITSDHGNLLGERGLLIPIRNYGHGSNLRFKKLVTVPWAVYQTGERREITEGDINSQSDASEDEVQERLRDLGYLE